MGIWSLMRAFPDGTLGDEPEWRLLVTRLNAIPSYLAVARENLEAGRRAGNMADRRMVQRDGIETSALGLGHFFAAGRAYQRVQVHSAKGNLPCEVDAQHDHSRNPKK